MKPNLDSQARHILASANLYNTKSRVAILKVLLSADKPLTKKLISQKLGKKCPDKVTIYRTLASLCKAGSVHRAYIHNREWHFELANHCTSVQCHPHFTCKNCGVTKCLTGLSVPVVKGLKKGFVIHRQQVRLEGLCPQCS